MAYLLGQTPLPRITFDNFLAYTLTPPSPSCTVLISLILLLDTFWQIPPLPRHFWSLFGNPPPLLVTFYNLLEKVLFFYSIRFLNILVFLLLFDRGNI